MTVTVGIVQRKYVSNVTAFASKIMGRMRINLVTPFADKDKAKALGARWDVARKVWYIVDIADLAPFMRWIPDMDAAVSEAAVSASAPLAVAGRQTTKNSAPAVTTRSATEVPSCGCAVLPWDDCAHTGGQTSTSP